MPAWWPANRSSPQRAKVGGAERDRTDDLKLAKLALSQLSYSPVSRYPSEFLFPGVSRQIGVSHPKLASRERRMVGPGGVEPPTSRLSGVRSNHLSYEPVPVARSFIRHRTGPSFPRCQRGRIIPDHRHRHPTSAEPGKAMRTAQRICTP